MNYIRIIKELFFSRAIPAEFSDLSVLSKCKTRRERRDLKENNDASKWSSSFNLYEYTERRNEIAKINADSELKKQDVSVQFDEETYHSGKIITNQMRTLLFLILVCLWAINDGHF